MPHARLRGANEAPEFAAPWAPLRELSAPGRDHLAKILQPQARTREVCVVQRCASNDEIAGCETPIAADAARSLRISSIATFGIYDIASDQRMAARPECVEICSAFRDLGPLPS